MAEKQEKKVGEILKDSVLRLAKDRTVDTKLGHHRQTCEFISSRQMSHEDLRRHCNSSKYKVRKLCQRYAYSNSHLTFD